MNKKCHQRLGGILLLAIIAVSLGLAGKGDIPGRKKYWTDGSYTFSSP